MTPPFDTKADYAFPFLLAERYFCPGMTLRDYFAAKALTGICASSPTDDFTDQRLAREAYNLADAMIKARSRK